MPAARSLDEVVVIIPARTGAPSIAECVAQVKSLGFSNLMVVWDGPPTTRLDGTPQRALPAGSGAARARNLGVAETDAPVLFFLDADVILDPGAPTVLLSGLKRWSAFIGSYDRYPRGNGFIAQYRDLVHHFTHQRLPGEIQTFFTALGVVTREAFEKVGGFRTWGAIEDVDFGYRLGERGYEVGVEKALLGSHTKPWTLRTATRTDLWGRGVPWTKLLLQDWRRVRNSPSLDRSSQLSVLAVWAGWISLLFFGDGLALIFLGLFLGANLSLLAFLTRCRGPVFGAKSLVATAYFHSLRGLAFILGFGSFWLGKVSRSRPVETVAKMGEG